VAAILVHIDLDGDRPHASSLVALAAGRHVASSWGATLYAALTVHDPSERKSADSTGQITTTANVPGLDAIETALALAGADKVVVGMTDAAIAPLWAMVGAAWQGVLDHLRPRLVLFGADAPSAAELAPRTGARIGARLLSRARALGIDDVELRDKDGGYARVSDSGAAVALIGRADAAPRGEDDVDLVVLALPGAESRVELAGTLAAELQHTSGAVVALGDDALDPKIVADAKKLAALLGAQLVGGPAAARAGAVPAGAVVERTTPLAPELCIAIGNVQLDLAGAASVVKIGGRGGKAYDGALSGQADVGLRELVQRLEKT
jgi:electron transfer flavoprotein alpha subunit